MYLQGKNSWTKGQNRHFVDFLLNAREELIAEEKGSAKYLHDDNLKNVVLDIFGAGTSTSKTILGFSFLHLANDLELQDELREEIVDALGSRVCGAADRGKMPKVDSFLREVIRVHPPAPLGIGRRTQADIILNRRPVPIGTDMFMNILAVNHDKAIWGPDAGEFNPRRFLTATKEQVNRGATSFGLGARTCPGEKMAQADMLYAIVRTLQNVRLTCPDGPGTANLNSIDSDLLIDAVRQDLIFTRIDEPWIFWAHPHPNRRYCDGAALLLAVDGCHSGCTMALVELFLVRLTEPISWIALVLGLLTAYLIQFVNRVRKLPPGPSPLPFIGNIPQLRSEIPLYEKAIDWARQYGDPITVWIGPRPFVIASSKESFKDISGPLRNLIAGRNPTNIGALQTRGYQDVLFSDFSPAWDTLRRVAHVAMRKYATTEKLANLVAETVDSELEGVFEGRDECRYEVVEFIEGIINNVLALSSFGEGFKKGDENFEKMRRANRDFEVNSPNGLPSDILPILRYLFPRQERAARGAILEVLDVTDEMFAKARATWTSGKSRHFTDVLLNAREEFVAEDRNSAKYLTDENLRQVVLDIFGAGTGTSRGILSYCCVELANDPELQSDLRTEILEELGSKRCTAEDRERLPRTDSFLQEIIRYYPAAPLSLPRKAMTNTTINGRPVPKDIDVMINLYAVNRDESIWGSDAGEFRPYRFLNVTKDQLTRGSNSFGIGARSCPGEKLAQADMFYAIVRTLQRVKLTCVHGPGTADFGKKNSDIFLESPRQNLIFAKVDTV
ncbi:steroid 17-alpha-hydroxylase/17,20 lyase [Galendromus occidentalis]|uniref:Steroid 17-alpha-hydroxylase/17,20 lyase n=1 Tax=Galendromus occidentalis TaxID=34638 RepID=A0AAJ7WIH0_9ACAR|nr:steroid 17-alpha-hydroxylase/17,20 lyase [Galendromus occidentalis]